MQKTHRLRVLIVAFLSMLVFAGIETRLYILQVNKHRHYVAKAQGQQKKTITLARRRGEIMDCNGQILATSTLYDTIYYNPAALKDDDLPAGLSNRVARLLKMPDIKVQQIFAKKHRTLLVRKVPPEVADALRVLEDDMNLPDGLLSFDKESKRLYPQGDLAGPIIGYTKIDDFGDNIGQEALELQYNEQLSGKNKKQKIPVNSWRQGLLPLDEKILKETYGNNVVLTLDSQVQHYAQKALRRRVGEVQAEGGAAVVLDVKSGGILALASCPDFDPNQFSKAQSVQRRNRALTDPFEIGSVMKILTATILIDNNLLRPDEMVDCQGGNGFVDGRHFKDSHPLGVVPFRIAFADSSNIAAAKLGLRLEPKLYYESLKRFGLGIRLGIDLPGENRGVLRPVSQWTRLSRTSLPVGYETAMTALQVVTALGAVANEGKRMKPHIVQRIETADGQLVKEFQPEVAAQVARPETCHTMLGLMEAVVSEGTGDAAKVAGYSVAGKTGTTRKVMEGKHYISSFAGVIPASNPKLAIYVYIEEPNPKIEYYGGKVSAPVFQEIAENSMRILGIPPDKPEELSNPAKSVAAVSTTIGISGARALPLSGENVDGLFDDKDEMTAKEIAATGREIALANASAAADAPGTATLAAAEDGFIGPDLPREGEEIAEARATLESIKMPAPLNTAARKEMLVERVRAEQAAREVRQGVMPLCVGLTMPAVVDLMAKADVPLKLEGSGLAVRQNPAAGARIEEGQAGVVVFALPSKRMDGNEPGPEVPAKPAGAKP
ncbi:transpeptidase family protein [Candidatus Sumerlaeota bacterium]|nr:transpeptidase family protein [Candidatus Sumerlaeota bacterium]